MNLQDVWVLEYSQLQGCFHVERLQMACVINGKQVRGDTVTSDYLPIFAGTKQQCHEHGEAIRNSGVKLIGRG
jgi:hypothetical protein